MLHCNISACQTSRGHSLWHGGHHRGHGGHWSASLTSSTYNLPVSSMHRRHCLGHLRRAPTNRQQRPPARLLGRRSFRPAFYSRTCSRPRSTRTPSESDTTDVRRTARNPAPSSTRAGASPKYTTAIPLYVGAKPFELGPSRRVDAARLKHNRTPFSSRPL